MTPHPASVPSCPANMAVGALLLAIAAAEYFRQFGSMPEWAAKS